MSDFTTAWSIYRDYYDPHKLFPAILQPENKATQTVASLLEIADAFDVLLLDGFGVLNVGVDVIPEMPMVVNQLIDAGKPAFVLTNGASFPSSFNAKRYPNLGYNIPSNRVISSRDALEIGIKDHPLTLANKTWGVISAERYEPSTIPAHTVLLTDSNIDTVDGFVFLGTLAWDSTKQKTLVHSLAQRQRPILIGNPDVCAPLAGGFSTEPGFYCVELINLKNSDLTFYGKPFQSCYRLSLERIELQLGVVDPARILMVGDTLHTDILGGNTAGMKTALMTDWGFLRDKNPAPFIEESGIIPDFIITSR